MADTRAKVYSAVTPGILEELRRIVGPRNVLVDAERLEAYSHDETDAREYGHMPEVVVLPSETGEVAEVAGWPIGSVYPSRPEARVGLSGGAIPGTGASWSPWCDEPAVG
jgi:glycolate oxidase